MQSKLLYRGEPDYSLMVQATECLPGNLASLIQAYPHFSSHLSYYHLSNLKMYSNTNPIISSKHYWMRDQKYLNTLCLYLPAVNHSEELNWKGKVHTNTDK